mmetsp:Transcript_1605/g.4817  ORF Transcript_1605/g.4817 Transcript_1605/m.4817 type:complete len:199 (-) Transcript_1605:102-698(-)
MFHQGCDAIAVVARFPDDEDEDQLQAYREGGGVDAIAGAEAIISHLVTHELNVPCAHAPALPPLNASESVSPKAAAEELGYTFLPCVLVGLSNAPLLLPSGAHAVGAVSTVSAGDVDAVVVPASACGGSAVLSLAEKGALVIAVEENRTALGVFPEDLGIDVVRVRNYPEAAGVLLARQNGIPLESLSSSVDRTPQIS